MPLWAGTAPSSGGGGSQTPWTADEDAAGYNLKNVDHISFSGAVPPTLSSPATGITASFFPSSSARDASGQLRIQTASSGSWPSGTALVTVTWGTAYPGNGPAFIGLQSQPVAGVTPVNIEPFAVGTGYGLTFYPGFQLLNGVALSTGTTYQVSYQAFG